MLKEVTLHILLADAFKTTLLERDVIVEDLPIQLQEWALDNMPTISIKAFKDYTVDDSTEKFKNLSNSKMIYALKSKNKLVVSETQESHFFALEGGDRFGEIKSITKKANADNYELFIQNGLLYSKRSSYYIGVLNN